jgi:hypothetical protein
MYILSIAETINKTIVSFFINFFGFGTYMPLHTQQNTVYGTPILMEKTGSGILQKMTREIKTSQDGKAMVNTHHKIW